MKPIISSIIVVCCYISAIILAFNGQKFTDIELILGFPAVVGVLILFSLTITISVIVESMVYVRKAERINRE